MAARRGKSQATRHSNQATPAWVWLLLGLLVGVAIFFIAPGLLKKDGDGFFRPQPNPDAQPAPADVTNVEEVAPESQTPSPQPATTDEAKETQYDFYTLLPGKEVQMSDAELAASAREEEARRARALLTAGNDTPVAPPAATLPRNPTPVTETPGNRPTPANTSTGTTATVATASKPVETSAAATVASANTGARYILQAGAFGASGDAEAAKAKIALLGLGARVESARINGKTVYRVRMGPYGTASELADAKQKLADGGLPAMAIKAQ